jgi:heterotetrameric sarcosine oxidase alpha subunit
VTGQPNRLATGGRIDRATTFAMRFDGRTVAAHPGDTLASALLANGVGIVGRSFKYHRPRGIVAAGVEEPNALLRLRQGARAEPNSRATTVEAFAGLEAASQGGWPSVGFDVGAALGAFARFMPSGFYYKTFFGSGRSTARWMFFERFIRRAASAARGPGEPDPDAYEKVNAFCDVLVIGAGPAGLAAALAAGRAGARGYRVALDSDAGGALLDLPGGGAGDAWRDAVLAELLKMLTVRILTRTTAFGAFDGEVYGLIERVWDHVAMPPAHQPRQRYWLVRAGAAVLASGAIERPLVFGNNDRPGVMLAGAVRAYLNRYGVLCGRRVVLCTGNDSVYATAAELARAGATVTVADLRRDAPVASPGVTVLAGHAVVTAQGRRHVAGALVCPVDAASGQTSGAPRRIDCDLLATSGGFTPSVHLWSQRGGKPVYDAARGAFLPVAGVVPRLLCAGAAAGEDRLAATVATGFAAGAEAARLVRRDGAVGDLAPPAVDDAGWCRDAALVSAICAAGGDAVAPAFVDLQHDVKRSDLALAHREGYVSVEHLKRYTTAGMANDQGKTANVNVLGRLAELNGVAMGEVGTTTFRPPFTPISFGAIAGGETGKHFRPTRLTSLDEWHVARGAPFVDAGLWRRPSCYPQPGESVADAALREARQVREAVGIVDVSTLGKIAVQGPDAAELLDRVYINAFRSLKVGRLRYGVMLRDDGFVYDDGATARLAETEFVMSTTTTNAARVLGQLEHLLQTAWTSLRVQVTSVTDQWAAIAVAGPQSRALLQAACPGADFSTAALPNMALTYGEIAGAPVRIHRMSYSGELAYEVFIPAGFGQAVWEALLAAGAAFGVVPYGTEAMGTLRIEKGHVAGGELDGRTTLKDLALERFASVRKPFIGAVLRRRPVLEDPARPSLVGLQPVDPAKPIRPGALLFPEGGEIAGHGEGHVTSVTFSPAVGSHIGLALLARGQTRVGEMVRVVDLLAGETVPCRVTAPCFVDPEGVRQNG